ncbi:MAG: alanine racemase [Rhodobacteraceae bacterium]|nr:alanine racemase [Paracoccaceae bacterium]
MPSDIVHASWCEISPKRIAKNLQLALGLLPKGAQFCAVLKADAYGHGIDRVVPIICEQGVNYVGITSNEEARAVRAAGFRGTIMRLRSATPDEIRGAVRDQVEEQVGTLYAAQVFRGMARQNTKVPKLHLSINAGGISRDGVELSSHEGRQACLEILDTIGQHIVGICSHFPSNVVHDLALSNLQFQKDVDWVFNHSPLRRDAVKVHTGSSLTLVSEQNVTTGLFRCGAIMYGILKPELGFRPTMALKSRVTNLATYPQGSTIGYDRATYLKEDRRLANVSLGYANGIRRSFFNKSSVLVRGRVAPILGKISMNTITVDVTDLPEVAVGDEVVLFGQQGAGCIENKHMELQAETIMADVFADWGQRNHRVGVE